MAHGFKSFLLSAIPWLLLLFMGIAWGLSFSVARIAILNGGMAFGITFWQNLVCGSLLMAYSFARGRPLPMSPRHIRFYFIVAILGTSVPASCFYLAAEYVANSCRVMHAILRPLIREYLFCDKVNGFCFKCPASGHFNKFNLIYLNQHSMFNDDPR